MIGATGDTLLQSIDIAAFQDLILQVIKLVLTKKEAIMHEDKAIIELAMSIWISCIVFNQDLL